MTTSASKKARKPSFTPYYLSWSDRFINHSRKFGPFRSKREAVNLLKKHGWKKTAKGFYEHDNNKWIEIRVNPVSLLMEAPKLFPRIRRLRRPKI